ncbi:unnamed protein product [Somion occarium]|uniref:DAGKc domain-containing protein n=1 Tax=Somion occarium TaxID=3059160 RepID=A0ABP1DA43_9APHY
MTLVVVYNPVCGDRTAEKFFNEEVLPRLKEQGKIPDKVIATTHPNHAGETIVELLKQTTESLTVILGSGDGTLHEIATSLHHSLDRQVQSQVAIVLVPCGTANALYSSLFPSQSDDPSYRLKSLNLYLSPSPTSIVLSSATTVVHPSQPGGDTRSSVAIVVASTALHAAILHDSEALRSSHPGIERFKIAAQQNITRWYHARVKLVPSHEHESVELYDVSRRSFIAVTEEGSIELEGPFTYFLSTVNVDRLESLFRIAPLHATLPSRTPALDIVIVRPLRNPTINDDSEGSRLRFAEQGGIVLGGAYRDGAHSVVEYYRCGGWEWIPDRDDEHARFVCVDGEIFNIEAGGKATTSISGNIHGTQLSIFA